MASSISFMEAETTFLGALTTTFTPPSSCLSTTAAVDSTGVPFQMYVGGVADTGLVASGNWHTECYPSHYPATAGDNFGAYFSPGVCPSGYTTAATTVQAPETRAICCLIGLTANDLLNCQTSFSRGSFLTASQLFTVDPGPLHPIETGTKTGDDLLLIGSAIEIRYRAGGASAQPSATIQPQTTQTTTSYDTYIPSNTGEGAAFTQTRTTIGLVAGPTIEPASFGLSEGARIGIGVAVPVAVLIVLGAGVAVFSTRRSARLRAARAAARFSARKTSNSKSLRRRL